MKKPIIAAIALFFSFGPLATSAGARGIAVEKPYARLVPPGSDTTGIFMTVRNTGSTDRRLTGVESPIANSAELHFTVSEQDVVMMRRTDYLTVPAKSRLKLKPGGNHIMLIGLGRSPEEGDGIPLTLLFDDGSAYSLSVPVKRIAPLR